MRYGMDTEFTKHLGMVRVFSGMLGSVRTTVWLRQDNAFWLRATHRDLVLGIIPTEFNGLNMGIDSRPACKVVYWQNDWNKFKRIFKATGQLNGIADALRYGEYLANEANTEKVEMSDKFPSKVENIVYTENLQSKALEQSPRLAALLTLALH